MTNKLSFCKLNSFVRTRYTYMYWIREMSLISKFGRRSTKTKGKAWILFLFKINSLLRLCLLILEKGRGETARKREGNGEGEEEGGRERNIDVREEHQLPPEHAPTGNWTHNLGMCPDWRQNLQPFGVWDDTPSCWTIWPGHKACVLLKIMFGRKTYQTLSKINFKACTVLELEEKLSHYHNTSVLF